MKHVMAMSQERRLPMEATSLLAAQQIVSMLVSMVTLVVQFTSALGGFATGIGALLGGTGAASGLSALIKVKQG